MSLIVQKYGGTSMGSVERIEHVAAKVAATRAQGHQVVVVVSAAFAMSNNRSRAASTCRAATIKLWRAISKFSRSVSSWRRSRRIAWTIPSSWAM